MTFVRPRGFRRHDLTHSPEGLWQLDGDMLDSSGNSHTLTVEAGTETYGSLGNLTGFYFDGSTNLWRSSADSGLLELGDITLEMLVSFHTDDAGFGVNSDTFLVYHGASGESLATNTAYSLGPENDAIGLRYGAEHGSSGTNISYSPDESTGTVGEITHIALVRENDDVTIYANGVSQGSSSSLSAPEGGTSGRFRVGSAYNLTRPIVGVISSLKFVTSALSAEEIAAEYRRTAA